MSKVDFSITIQGDTEGYITFECPFCGSEFKLQAEEYQNEDMPIEELFCPYCGLAKDKNNFFSDEVHEQIQAVMENYIIEQLNKSFGKLNRSTKKSKFIQVKYKPLKKVTVKELKDKDTVETIFNCSSCGQHVKVLYCAGVSKIFCPYCGVDM